MPDSILVLDPAGGEPTSRPLTPEEQAQLDADRQAAAAASIRYGGARPLDARARTTDDQPHEVLRLPTEPKHVYRATVRVCGIDAGNGTTRDSEVRMVFKRAGVAPSQVGSTTVMSNAQDTAAASWRIAASVDGTDLVISVTGAAGRTVDWQVTGEIGAFAPEGVAPA
ncbi:MAG: hypothetical protein ACJ77I_06900 [Chloroflexota bacterium]